jgi:CheY-like chemotaxis protein
VALIVNDDPLMADLIADLVQGAGYAVMVGHSGLVALALAKEQRPDVLITDLYMPDLDGAGLIAALRESGGPRVPTILITGSSRTISHLKMADAVLKKPFSVVALVAALALLSPLDHTDHDAALV